MMGQYNYDETKDYPGAYSVSGYSGIAFSVYGYHTEPDEDTEWSGYENRTGDLVMVMVGDDRMHRVDPDDITRIEPDDYCGECGQIGCGCG